MSDITPEGPRPIQKTLDLRGGVDRVRAVNKEIKIPHTPMLHADVEPFASGELEGQSPFLPMGTPLIVESHPIITLNDLGVVADFDTFLELQKVSGNPNMESRGSGSGVTHVYGVPINPHSFVGRKIDFQHLRRLFGSTDYISRLKRREGSLHRDDLGTQTYHPRVDDIENGTLWVYTHPHFLTSATLPQRATQQALEI